LVEYDAAATEAHGKFGFPKPIPNSPKSGQIQPSPAKDNQRKSFDFLRRIEPFQRVMPTPKAFFLFSAASAD
jgi:hypothetical protein